MVAYVVRVVALQSSKTAVSDPVSNPAWGTSDNENNSKNMSAWIFVGIHQPLTYRE